MPVGVVPTVGGISFRADRAHVKQYYFSICRDYRTYCLARYDNFSALSDFLIGCTAPDDILSDSIDLYQRLTIGVVARKPASNCGSMGNRSA
jgi:hypothetical protein